MALAAAPRSGESTGYLSRSAKSVAISELYAAHFCSAASLIWSGSLSSGKLAPLSIYYMAGRILGTTHDTSLIRSRKMSETDSGTSKYQSLDEPSIDRKSVAE